jgi:Protein of unknown function (DUF2782)
MRILLLPTIISFSLFVSSVTAEDAVPVGAPEIRIEQGEDATYYEHRVNGVLKEIKVVPDIGPEYYLVPVDGEGWIREERSTVLVPKWVLFEW